MKTELSMSELESAPATEPIWVLNTAVRSDVGQAGEIILGVPKINGSKIDPLHIPQTWLPIEITRMIPRGQLLAASEFRQSIENKLITPISKEYAQKILSEEGAKEERERLDELRKHIRAAGAAKTLGGAPEVVMVDSETAVTTEASAKKSAELDAAFVMFAERLVGESDISALNSIRSRGRFSKKELLHLKKVLVNHPKSVAKIQERLSTIKAKKPA
jgi:hypothetical protein